MKYLLLVFAMLISASAFADDIPKSAPFFFFPGNLWLVPPLDVYEPGTECAFRREFALDARPGAAVLLLAADGFAEAGVNGERVGHVTARYGPRSSRNRIGIRIWNVSNHLVEGTNVITIKIRRFDGANPEINPIMRIRNAEGATIEIRSDSSWESSCVPKHGWDADTINENLWKPAAVAEGPRL